METIYTGKLVRIRPFKSARELFDLSVRLNSETHDALYPIWFPLAAEEKLFEPDGFMNPGEICGFGIERLTDGHLVGIEACFFGGRGQLSAEVGTTIDKSCRGQGFGNEAKLLASCFLFENFPLERMEAVTFSNNMAAQRSLELCGMHREGIRRGTFFSRGQYVDGIHYVLLRNDWERLPIRRIVKHGDPGYGASDD